MQAQLEIHKDVSYTRAQKLDVYALSAQGHLPTVALLHAGDDVKERYEQFSAAIAELGAVVFTPQWHSSIPSSVENASAGYDEVACAIRFARAKSPEYGGDPNR